MNIANDITERVGKTPLVRLHHIGVRGGAEILAKLESLNPTGSVKDRVAVAILDAAESGGHCVSGVTTIVEASLGDMAESLAMVCAVRDYRLIICVPDSVGSARVEVLKAYGAEVELTDGALGVAGASARAQEISDGVGEFFWINQFSNPVNPTIHYLTTAEEIWRDCDGAIDILVAGVGTGGTVTGIGKRLKELREDIVVVAVEPKECMVLSGASSEKHDLAGIGPGFVGDNYNATFVDAVMSVESESAHELVEIMALKEGIMVGPSSGAALAAAREISGRAENVGKTIVVVVPSFS